MLRARHIPNMPLKCDTTTQEKKKIKTNIEYECASEKNGKANELFISPPSPSPQSPPRLIEDEHEGGKNFFALIKCAPLA